MGLYGYYRDTTPFLNSLKEKDPNFIYFDKAVSTHTHTSLSLLEALSVSTDPNDYQETIYDRKRKSVVDILRNNGIESILFSNQGQTGSWNLASKIIFKNSKNTFSTNSKLIGNSDYKLNREFEHIFLDKFIQEFKKEDSNQNKAFFFHSYTGHGPYEKNIPTEFSQVNDDFFKINNHLSILGENISEETIPNIERYDSAIRYIDYILEATIKQIKNTKKPIMFIYFSDHGESVYTGRGHDSSRFTHEMIRVPLVIYFNDAAKEKNPDIFNNLSSLSSKKNIIPLSQISHIILEAHGLKLNQETIPQTFVNRRTNEDKHEFFVLDEYSKRHVDAFKTKTDNANEFLRISSKKT